MRKSEEMQKMDKENRAAERIVEKIFAGVDAMAIACGKVPSRPPEYWACMLMDQPTMAVTEKVAREYLSGCKSINSLDIGWAEMHIGEGVGSEHFVVVITRDGHASISSGLTAPSASQ